MRGALAAAAYAGDAKQVRDPGRKRVSSGCGRLQASRLFNLLRITSGRL